MARVQSGVFVLSLKVLVTYVVLGLYHPLTLCASLWIRPTMVHTSFCVGRLSILFWTSRDTRKLLPSIVSSPHFLNPTYFQLPSSHLRNRHLPHNKMHNLRVPLAQEDDSIFQTVMELFNFCQIELNIHYFFLLFFSLLYLALFSVYRMPFHVHSRGGSLVATPFWFLYFHFISYVCLLFSIHRHCHCLHKHTRSSHHTSINVRHCTLSFVYVHCHAKYTLPFQTQSLSSQQYMSSRGKAYFNQIVVRSLEVFWI